VAEPGVLKGNSFLESWPFSHIGIQVTTRRAQEKKSAAESSGNESSPKELVLTWQEVLLIVASAALVLQLFPALWHGLIAYLDPRGWGWRSYAVASTIWILFFVGLKAWRDSSEE